MTIRRRVDNETGSLYPYDDFPYLLTEIVPGLYHVILLPRGRPFSELENLAHRQVRANRLPTWLMFDQRQRLFFREDASKQPAGLVPSGRLVTGKLGCCEPMPISEEVEVRLRRLSGIIGQEGELDTGLLGTPHAIRAATPKEIVPNLCARCGEQFVRGIVGLDHTCDESVWSGPEDAEEVERGRVAERAINWEAFRGEIKARAPLGPAILAAAETHEARDLLKTEYLRDGIMGEEICALSYLNDMWFPTECLITFEWSSLGPMAWDASLNLLDIGVGLDYVVFCQDVEEDQIIDAIEGTNWPSSATTLLRQVCGSFTALPSWTENYRPDLIPGKVVKASYWDFLEQSSSMGSPSWGELRQILIKELVKEPFRPVRKVLGEAFKGLPPQSSLEQIDLWLKGRREKEQQETEELTVEDRQRILDTYFATSYREHSDPPKNGT